VRFAFCHARKVTNGWCVPLATCWQPPWATFTLRWLWPLSSLTTGILAISLSEESRLLIRRESVCYPVLLNIPSGKPFGHCTRPSCKEKRNAINKESSRHPGLALEKNGKRGQP